MDDHGDFDSVSWQREDTQQVESSAPFQANLPTRPGDGRRSGSMSSEPQAGEHADNVDLAGIGRDGILEVTVDSPLKENDGTKDAYVSYLVTTHTDFKTFQKTDFSVRRRFTDFVFLRQTLHRDYPACAVPPLPEKNNMAGTVSGEGSGNTAAPTGFFDNVADTMLNAFSKVHKPDKRFIEVTERANKLDEDLSHVEKIVARVVRREGDLELDYADLATNMRKLTPLEPAIEAPIQTFAGCVEETSRGWKGLKDHTDQNYLGSLRDMEAYINSVKSLLKTREQKQLDFEGLTEYLQKATAERDMLASNNPYSHGSHLNPATFIRNKVEDMRGVDHETARKDRARKLELKIAELNREVESAKSTSEMFDEQVVREVADFERIKGLEFRDTLGALATQHIDFYQNVISTWERFLVDMDLDADKHLHKDKGKAET
ncbi:cytochrome P450, partial [Aureobasidium melanogenum]